MYKLLLSENVSNYLYLLFIIQFFKSFCSVYHTVLIDVLRSLGIDPGLDLEELATMGQVFQH